MRAAVAGHDSILQSVVRLHGGPYEGIQADSGGPALSIVNVGRIRRLRGMQRDSAPCPRSPPAPLIVSLLSTSAASTFVLARSGCVQRFVAVTNGSMFLPNLVIDQEIRAARLESPCSDRRGELRGYYWWMLAGATLN
jgi:hypothetical protein